MSTQTKTNTNEKSLDSQKLELQERLNSLIVKTNAVNTNWILTKFLLSYIPLFGMIILLFLEISDIVNINSYLLLGLLIFSFFIDTFRPKLRDQYILCSDLFFIKNYINFIQVWHEKYLTLVSNYLSQIEYYLNFEQSLLYKKSKGAELSFFDYTLDKYELQRLASESQSFYWSVFLSDRYYKTVKNYYENEKEIFLNKQLIRFSNDLKNTPVWKLVLSLKEWNGITKLKKEIEVWTLELEKIKDNPLLKYEYQKEREKLNEKLKTLETYSQTEYNAYVNVKKEFQLLFEKLKNLNDSSINFKILESYIQKQ